MQARGSATLVQTLMRHDLVDEYLRADGPGLKVTSQLRMGTDDKARAPYSQARPDPANVTSRTLACQHDRADTVKYGHYCPGEHGDGNAHDRRT